jgi:hypothetical protein
VQPQAGKAVKPSAGKKQFSFISDSLLLTESGEGMIFAHYY